jgi:hypothetical protein
MTDKASDELEEINLAEEENEEEDENDYIPRFIRKVLDNPQLLPREIRTDFLGVFEDFEFTHLGRAKTTLEYILVNEATKLTLSLQHLDRIEKAIIANQQRPAVESLFRKAHNLKISAGLTADKYFADPVFRARSDEEFEAAGYAPDALEGEAYLRALPSLAVFHRQKAADRKALFGILKELESRYASRHREKKMVVRSPRQNHPNRRTADGVREADRGQQAQRTQEHRPSHPRR